MKGSKLLSDTNPTVTARSDSLVIFSSDSSDPSVVTPYSDAVVVTLYSVVVRFYSVYSDYSVYSVVNHLDSLYSVVVRGLCELCVEFFIVYSVNQQ